MQQSVRATLYRGARVRLTGYLKAGVAPEELAAAGLFVRVDGDDMPLASDYMIDRSIHTTQDWTPVSIVIDVPTNAAGITFGFYLAGKGQVWLDDVTFETVGRDVAPTRAAGREFIPQALLTGRSGEPLWQKYLRAPLRPVNLNFEEIAIVGAW
jgi:hypothetical protein